MDAEVECEPAETSFAPPKLEDFTMVSCIREFELDYWWDCMTIRVGDEIEVKKVEGNGVVGLYFGKEQKCGRLGQFHISNVS